MTETDTATLPGSPGDLLIAWWGDYRPGPEWQWWPATKPGGLAWRVVTGQEIDAWPLAVAETAVVVTRTSDEPKGWRPESIDRECEGVMAREEAKQRVDGVVDDAKALWRNRYGDMRGWVEPSWALRQAISRAIEQDTPEPEPERLYRQGDVRDGLDRALAAIEAVPATDRVDWVLKSLSESGVWIGLPTHTAQDRLDAVRDALAGLGYFEPGEIGPDLAPRIIEVWSALTGALIDLRDDLQRAATQVPGTTEARISYGDGYVNGLYSGVGMLDKRAPWVATAKPPERQPEVHRKGSIPGWVIEPSLLNRALADPGSIVKRYGYWNEDSPAEYREKPDMEPLYLWQARAVAWVLAHPNDYPEEFTSRPPIEVR